MSSVAQAARAAGKSKPTIARAIEAGRLSATRGEGGSYLIDPSELARVFHRAGDTLSVLAQVRLKREQGPFQSSVVYC